MHKKTSNFLAPILALVISTSSLVAVAQTSKKSSSRSKSTASQKETKSKYHRLPAYYGKLKLKSDQIEEIYEIRDKFGPKIADLQKELDALKKQEAEDIKDVLTRTQVTAYNKLKAGNKTGSKSSSRSKSSSTKKK